MKSFIVKFDPDKHKELKIFCTSKGITMQEFVTKAVEEYRKKWVV